MAILLKEMDYMTLYLQYVMNINHLKSLKKKQIL